MKFVNREPIFSEKLLAGGMLGNFVLSAVLLATYMSTGIESALNVAVVSGIWSLIDLIGLEYINWYENKKKS